MKRAAFLIPMVLVGIALYAQDESSDFGFGFDAEPVTNNTTPSIAPKVVISGEVSAELKAFPDDISGGLDETRIGDIFSGKLNFEAEGSKAEAYINLKLGQAGESALPISIDEAYVRSFLGPIAITGGLRKLTWGKADSMGPLDVVNPLDYSDLSKFSGDLNEIKIARPLILLSWNIGNFSKVEGVFVPTFEGMRFADSGRWVPSQMINLTQIAAVNPFFTVERPDTATLKYMQGGLRFTATAGSHDFGVQYYYGRLHRPAFEFSLDVLGGQPVPVSAVLDYNPYHQIGADWAAVLFGLNIRAEVAANLTGDFTGDDGAVYNPALAWSFGFDRDLFWGINLNLQCNESITLFHDNIADNQLLDTEAGTDVTTTQLTAKLSKKFLQDELECALKGIYDIENSAFLLMPALTWTKNDVQIQVSGGVFCGDDEGELGQFHDNSWLALSVQYSF